MNSQQVIEVGKALLPYLRNDLRPEELGMAAHDAAAALNRTTHKLRPEQAWQELIDKDDRTSPEDYPEMCLITLDELRDFMTRAP